MKVTLPHKTATDVIACDFDFADDLSYAETISTQSVTAQVYSGTDATPSTLISGLATSSDSIVSQNIVGGVAGVIYKLLCQVTTSTGQTLQCYALLAVNQDAP